MLRLIVRSLVVLFATTGFTLAADPTFTRGYAGFHYNMFDGLDKNPIGIMGGVEYEIENTDFFATGEYQRLTYKIGDAKVIGNAFVLGGGMKFKPAKVDMFAKPVVPYGQAGLILASTKVKQDGNSDKSSDNGFMLKGGIRAAITEPSWADFYAQFTSVDSESDISLGAELTYAVHEKYNAVGFFEFDLDFDRTTIGIMGSMAIPEFQFNSKPVQ